MSANPYLSVQALTKYIKRKFDADPHLRNVYVKGELSNVKMHPSGHIYFTLKDEKSRIQAAMFRSNASTLPFKPENGMNILITGDITVYEASGNYQLYVQTMQPDGIGALYLAFEQLKESLAKEGLFDQRWKQPLPPLPSTVGVVTAQSGAAIRDICSTIERRYPLAKIVLFPAIVQGPQATDSIVSAIQQAEQFGSIDVLIVGRGGGSIEDLWAFNEEAVARTIFSCKIPIISAVGHETDTTIADFVADFRAPTPTAAAEVAVPSKQQLAERILDRKRSIYVALSTKIQQETKRLTYFTSSYPLQYPDRLYRPFIEKLGDIEQKLKRAIEDQIHVKKRHLEGQTTILSTHTPVRSIHEHQRIVTLYTERLTREATRTLYNEQERFNGFIRMLGALNPLHVMERGFSIVYQQNQVIRDASSLKIDDTIEVRLPNGSVNATVTDIKIDKQTTN